MSHIQIAWSDNMIRDCLSVSMFCMILSMCLLLMFIANCKLLSSIHGLKD